MWLFLKGFHKHAKSRNTLLTSAFVWGVMQTIVSPRDLLTLPIATMLLASVVGAGYMIAAEFVCEFLPFPQKYQILNWVLWAAITVKMISVCMFYSSWLLVSVQKT